MRSTLFRPEVLDARQAPQLGTVLLAQPLALSLLTGLCALVAFAVVVFGCMADYTRKAHVSGYLVPTHGLIKVYTPQAGTLIERRVEEGQRVKRGDALYVLSTEHSSLQARDVRAQAISQLRERRSSLLRELDQQATLAKMAQRELRDRLHGLSSELVQMDEAIATQTERLARGRHTFERYEELARGKFVSEMHLAQQRDQVAEQQARLQALERTRSTLARDLRTLNAELAQQDPRTASARAALERAILALDQELTEHESRRSQVITAPVDGVVTTILAERAQSATPSAPLLSILPEGAALQAQLFVPSRSVGFIALQQPVALRYQAFPFERFGRQGGVVKEISRTLITPGEAALPVVLNEPVYRVTVSLDRQAVRAYGKEMPLQAGMLLDADIALDRRRLIEWVFEPLLAVAGRV
jgi:membrane fusion protein